MSLGKLTIVGCLVCLLAASTCTPKGALFSDVQRTPPTLKPATADYIIQNDREVAVWIGETKLKCEKFGCAQ